MTFKKPVKISAFDSGSYLEMGGKNGLGKYPFALIYIHVARVGDLMQGATTWLVVLG
jgi:hypothetical protein